MWCVLILQLMKAWSIAYIISIISIQVSVIFFHYIICSHLFCDGFFLHLSFIWIHSCAWLLIPLSIVVHKASSKSFTKLDYTGINWKSNDSIKKEIKLNVLDSWISAQIQHQFYRFHFRYNCLKHVSWYLPSIQLT